MVFIIIVFATIFGSFLNMLIYRLPKMINGENISPIYPQKSLCPNCKHSLNYLDLVPIISFLSTFGKCRYCKQKIKLRYILVELISVIALTYLYTLFALSWEFVYFSILSLGLILLFWSDFETQILPDIITLPLLWLGMLYNLHFGDIALSIYGAIIGYLSLWSIFWIFKLLRNKEGMGYGDFKLFALIGAWFGWQILNPILLVSTILAIVFYLIKIKNKNQEFAFGPWLIIALPIVLFFQVNINSLFY